MKKWLFRFPDPNDEGISDEDAQDEASKEFENDVPPAQALEETDEPAEDDELDADETDDDSQG